MADIPLSEVSSDFSTRFLVDLIERLEESFPDKHPQTMTEPFLLGYQAGAIEVIRRLKQELSSG